MGYAVSVTQVIKFKFDSVNPETGWTPLPFCVVCSRTSKGLYHYVYLGLKGVNVYMSFSSVLKYSVL